MEEEIGNTYVHFSKWNGDRGREVAEGWDGERKVRTQLWLGFLARLTYLSVCLSVSMYVRLFIIQPHQIPISISLSL